MSSNHFSVDTFQLQGSINGSQMYTQEEHCIALEHTAGPGHLNNAVYHSEQYIKDNYVPFDVDEKWFGSNAGQIPQVSNMGECSLVGAGGRHAASVDSGNQLVKSTDTARKNPLQRKQVFVNAPSTMVDASSQSQPQNIESNDVGFMAYFTSLSHQQQAKLQAFLKLMVTETSMRPGIEGRPGMNGVSTVMQAKEQVTVHQSNACHQTKDTNLPPSTRDDASTTTYAVVENNPPITRPNRVSNSNAAQGQAKTHTRQTPSRRNPFFDNPNYRWKGQNDTLALIEYMERLLGIKIRPDDHEIFIQEFIFGENLKKRCMGLNSQNPGYNQPQFVQGSSTGGTTVSLPRDDFLYSNHSNRRGLMSVLTHADSSSPLSSPLGNSHIPTRNTVDLVETLFVREEEVPCCTYKHPLTGAVCNALVRGSRRNRHQHLTIHAQSEGLLLSTGDIDVEDALVLTLLPKVVMSCDVGGCNYMEMVWRTNKAKLNHEKEYHPEVYLNRLHAKRQNKAKFWAKRVA